VKVREVIRLLEEDGRFLVATEGSHRSIHSSQDLLQWRASRRMTSLRATLNSILKQSGLKERQ